MKRHFIAWCLGGLALSLAADSTCAALVKGAVSARPEAIRNWRDKRFGMFIHWGPVSLKGTEISWSRGKQVPVEEYDSLYKRFNPVMFNADEWVAVAKAAGMRYIVLTAKHHDGFCLWDTKATDYNIMNTPFGRDVVRELSDACRRGGIAFGAYYSTCDWHHPDFPLTSPGGKTPRTACDLERYTDYLKEQTWELLAKYGPLLTLWYDVPQQFDARRGAGVINLARALQPDIVINNRTGHPGDYDTPEQRVGKFQVDRPWETCMTICRQWAWKPDDEMKSLQKCVHALLRTIGGDGNFLFNVGPQPDGRIEPRQVARLKEMGAWVAKHGEAIYGTRGGPWKPSVSMVSTRKDERIYLHFLQKPTVPVSLKGMPYAVKSARRLDGESVKLSRKDDDVTVSFPDDRWDGIATVVELTVEGDTMSIAPLPAFSPSSSLYSKVSASAVFGDKPQYAPEMALDGDETTRWATPAGTRQAWLRIDFARETRLSGLHVKEACCGHSSRVNGYEIQKLDGDSWSTFHSGARLGESCSIAFEPITTRAVRLKILDASEGPTFWEIEIVP